MKPEPGPATHRDEKGVIFDRSSTSDDVLGGIDLGSKTVLVTGASTGLGAETARALAVHGAALTLADRSTEKLTRVAEKIHSATGRKPEIASLELDTPSTIRSFAETWLPLTSRWQPYGSAQRRPRSRPS